jgi:hypothetical protein
MKKLIQLLFLLACYTYSVGQTVNYTASDAIIANPERGLQKYSRTSSDYSTTRGANNFTVATLKEWKNSKDKITVVYRIFMIDAFKNSDINSCLLYTSPSPRDRQKSRMPSSA